MLKTHEQLAIENEELKLALAARDRLLHLKDGEIRHLEDLVAFFRGARFAPKTETHHPGQGFLFDEAETNQSDECEEVEFAVDGNSDDPNKGRKKPIRKPLPEVLKRIERIIDLPDEEKFCTHLGTAFRRVGEEVSEQLDIVPAVIQVIRTIRPKYACSCGFSDCKFHIMPLEPQPIPKSNASAGLLAHVATAKYADHNPLHRQEEILGRIGCDLPRATLASWMIKCGELVTPLINLMRDQLLEAPLVFCDETAVQVLKGTGKKPTSKSYMWVQAKWGGIGQRIVLYNYETSRKGAVAAKLFEGYRGYVQTDGYEGYSRLQSIEGITLVGDWVHVRRAFHDVIKVSKASEKAKLANAALEFIAKLYSVESEIANMDPIEKLRIRTEKSKQIVFEFKAWADEWMTRVPPKSLIGKALNYFQGQWPKLTYFLEDPIVGLDTNVVENVIRPFALGRKNWMFSDTIRGADASANLYSLIITARVNNLDPYEYLKRVFSELPKAKTAYDIEKLLPGMVTIQP